MSPTTLANETFASLGVPATLVTALADNGISDPFPIQAATLPDALAGRDLLGRGKTGSGKTLAFSLPLVARLVGGKRTPRQARSLNDRCREIRNFEDRRLPRSHPWREIMAMQRIIGFKPDRCGFKPVRVSLIGKINSIRQRDFF